jgi:hypothetical protein
VKLRIRSVRDSNVPNEKEVEVWLEHLPGGEVRLKASSTGGSGYPLLTMTITDEEIHSRRQFGVSPDLGFALDEARRMKIE